MAAELGFEPRHTESESAVLPLHNSASRKCYYTQNREKVKHYFKKYFLSSFELCFFTYFTSFLCILPKADNMLLSYYSIFYSIKKLYVNIIKNFLIFSRFLWKIRSYMIYYISGKILLRIKFWKFYERGDF